MNDLPDFVITPTIKERPLIAVTSCPSRGDAIHYHRIKTKPPSC